MSIKPVHAKTLLATRVEPDTWFGTKYNMNIYRGCEHRCIYCDSRSECYQIENFDTEVIAKVNVAKQLRKELASKRIKGVIGFGAMSDPYTVSEGKLGLMRQSLEVIKEFKFPIHILTKGVMVLRDLDLIKEIAKEYAAVSFTITTPNDELGKKVEPFAPLPSARLAAIKQLSDQGIYSGVMMMPILPFIEDKKEDLIELVNRVADNGGKYVVPWIGMTLRDRQREYFYQKLDEEFPGMRQKYYQRFRGRYSASSSNARELYEKVKSQCKKRGLTIRMKIYKPKTILESEQGNLFGD